MCPRRCGSFALVLLHTIVVGTLVLAEPATTQTHSTLSRTDPQALIQQLGAEAFRDRQRAEDELVARGEASLDALRRASRSAADVEVRSRCDSAIQRIGEAMAIGPTPVTLYFEETSAIKAFAELAKQAHIELNPHPTNLWDTAAWPTVTLDLDRTPFWEAVNAITAQTGLGLDGTSSDDLRIIEVKRFMRRDARAIDHVAISGPFLIKATRVARSGSIDFEDGAADGDFSVSISVLAEPKLRILRAEPIVLQRADDDAGNSLLPLVPPGVRRTSSVAAYALRGSGAWQTNVKLREPERDQLGQRIARLAGSFTATLQTRADTFELEDLYGVNNAEGSIAGLDFAVKSLTRSSTNDQYELKIAITGARAEARELDQVRQKMLGSTMRLFANDRVLSLRASDQQIVEDQVELSWNFARERERRFGRRGSSDEDSGPPNIRMVWQVPIDSKRVEVPFVFKNLPIP